MQDLRRTTYLLNAVLLGSLALNLAWKPAAPRKFAGVDAAQVPKRAAGFVAEGESALDPSIQKALSSGTTIARTYYSGDGQMIDFILIGGTDRDSIHDPRSCLIGADWRILNDHSEPIPGTDIIARSCRIERPGEAFDVMYFYVIDDRTIHEATQIRLQMFTSALIGRQSRPTYFLRFLQPADRDHARMQQFAAQIWTALKPHLTHNGQDKEEFSKKR